VISTVEVRQAASLQISTELSQPQVEDQYNRGGFIVYNRELILRMIDRQLASSSEQYIGGQTGNQPPAEISTELERQAASLQYRISLLEGAS
jgi:hypothetical protein